MKSAEEIWSLLRTQVAARGVEEVGLVEALGRTLREAVPAPEDIPLFDRSAVDGFVVRAGDPAGVFDVAGEIRAGDPGIPALVAGRAFRIGTGAQVPAGGEIIMLEDAIIDGERVSFARRGVDHIRRRGEDARAGDELLAAGTELSAGAIALLASVGCVRPRVTRRVTCHHVTTGNEIVDPACVPGPGQIRDANSALVRAWGESRCLAVSHARVAEDAVALRGALRDDVDLTLVSGGASVGRHDHTAAVLRDAGFEILVAKVNARPGKPLIVARRGDQWAFGLPGNPLSHFVCLNVFVSAAIAAMNSAPPRPALGASVVAAGVPGNARETWWPARQGSEGLHPLRWASSGDLTALATADALIRVPTSGLASGDRAAFIRTT